MLHIKLRGNRPAGSEEEDFLSFFTIYGMVAILVLWPRCREQTFVLPTQGNLALIGQAVSEKMFEIVDDERRIIGIL